MAEFCWDCFKKYHKDAKKEDYVISKDDDLDLCEGCGEYKPVVIKAKEYSCHFYGFEIFGLLADLIIWLFGLIGKFIKRLKKK